MKTSETTSHSKAYRRSGIGEAEFLIVHAAATVGEGGPADTGEARVCRLDLLEAGLVDESWVAKLPGAPAARLQELLDNPGSGALSQLHCRADSVVGWALPTIAVHHGDP